MATALVIVLLLASWLQMNTVHGATVSSMQQLCKNMQLKPFTTNSTGISFDKGSSSPYSREVAAELSLDCCYKSSEKPSFSWYLYDRQIAVDATSLEDGFTHKETESIQKSSGRVFCSEIKKFPLSKSDAGIYTCKAALDAEKGFANRSICVIVSDKAVQYRPKVAAVNPVVRVHPYRNVTLSCLLTYVQRKHFFGWFFRNISMAGEHESLPTLDKAPSIMRLNLTVVNVTERDLGLYTCWANNFNGMAFANVSLQFFGPPTVTALASSPEPPKDKTVTLAVSILGALFAMVLLIGLYKLEKTRRRILSNRNMHRLYEGNEGSYQFDLFLSCSRENAAFAQEYLLPLLEGPPYNLRVCYHHRDFELGRDVLENMTHAVYRSCKVLIIISDNYLNSEYCKYEMDAALYRQLNEKYPCVALIRRGPMNRKLPQKLKAKNFLDLTNDVEQRHIEKRLKSFVKGICDDMKESIVMDNLAI